MKIDATLIDDLNRATAWLSFLIVAVYVITGFGMVDMWGVAGIIGKARCEYWHSNAYLAYVLVALLAVHGGICIYRTLKRNKII
ncbi:MAG: hypothetical protein NTU61_01620 [Candidatus Altiarchaeota archaeon]|nr:hypothetical protein [Candidatus Altiarchaeota archaeon]